jgi:hypothetical protein
MLVEFSGLSVLLPKRRFRPLTRGVALVLSADRTHSRNSTAHARTFPGLRVLD